MTARSSSWGFCLFGSFIWARTASRALGSGPFRMKCSKILIKPDRQRVGLISKLDHAVSFHRFRHSSSFTFSVTTVFLLLKHSLWDSCRSYLAAARVTATHMSLFCVTRVAFSTFSSISGRPANMATTGASLVTPSIWQSTSQPQKTHTYADIMQQPKDTILRCATALSRISVGGSLDFSSVKSPGKIQMNLVLNCKYIYFK